MGFFEYFFRLVTIVQTILLFGDGVGFVGYLTRMNEIA